MQFQRKYNRLVYFGFFAFILFIYLLFPSHNNSGDAWGYAAEAKYGYELFSPHHLLYTVTLYILKLCTGHQNTLEQGMVMNSVFALLSCVVLFQILKIISDNPLKALLLTATTAFSFGFWRFATENENYIIPIFFSLLGSLFFARSYVKQTFSSRYIVWSGIFATIACLYHQIHIFWFIGLLIGWIWIDGRANIKRGIVFASTFIMAPLAYFVVIVFYLQQRLSFNNIAHFVFHDYYTGSAGNRIGFNNFLLGGINFIRTFFQVHGQIWIMLTNNKLWLIPGFLALCMILFAMILIFRGKDLTTFKKLSNLNIVTNTHILIFILQLAFAVYNVGNAEFMAMLPVLSAIIIAKANWVPVKSIVLTAIALFTWNFSYGIYPNNQLHFNADSQVTQFIIDHPDDKFMITEPAEVSDQYYYKKGCWPENILPSLEYYQLHNAMPQLKARVDSALNSHGNIYTDYTGTPQIASRKTMVADDGAFFKSYNLKDTIAVFETDAGKHYIFRMSH